MPTLLPFRDLDEKDVVNLFSLVGASLPINKGTVVKLQGSGFVFGQDPLEFLGSPGYSINNVQSQRYGVPFHIQPAGTGDNAVGITLKDLKETDENGLPLKFYPRKAAELEAVISGQSMPYATKGRFMYSGITGAVTAGQKLYVGANGTIESVLASAQGAGGAPAAVVIGKALGAKSAQGYCFVELDFAAK